MRQCRAERNDVHVKRICKYCGQEYDGDPGGSCCPICAASQRKTTLRPRFCRTCGVTFIGGPRAWYCPSCRKERQREQKQKQRTFFAEIHKCVIYATYRNHFPVI